MQDPVPPNEPVRTAPVSGDQPMRESKAAEWTQRHVALRENAVIACFKLGKATGLSVPEIKKVLDRWNNTSGNADLETFAGSNTTNEVNLVVAVLGGFDSILQTDRDSLNARFGSGAYPFFAADQLSLQPTTKERMHSMWKKAESDTAFNPAGFDAEFKRAGELYDLFAKALDTQIAAGKNGDYTAIVNGSLQQAKDSLTQSTELYPSTELSPQEGLKWLKIKYGLVEQPVEAKEPDFSQEIDEMWTQIQKIAEHVDFNYSSSISDAYWKVASILRAKFNSDPALVHNFFAYACFRSRLSTETGEWNAIKQIAKKTPLDYKTFEVLIKKIVEEKFFIPYEDDLQGFSQKKINGTIQSVKTAAKSLSQNIKDIKQTVTTEIIGVEPDRSEGEKDADYYKRTNAYWTELENRSSEIGAETKKRLLEQPNGAGITLEKKVKANPLKFLQLATEVHS